MNGLPERLAYNPGEFAALIGRSKSWVIEQLRAGRRRGFQVGDRGTAWVIPADSASEFLTKKGAQ